jgi:hypothetical protein
LHCGWLGDPALLAIIFRKRQLSLCPTTCCSWR